MIPPHRLLAFILTLAPIFCAHAAPDNPVRDYRLYQDMSGSASRLREVLSQTSTLPLKKRYGDFTPAERTAFHRNYENIADGVEPPFPFDGLEPVIRKLVRGVERAGFEGQVQITTVRLKVEQNQLLSVASKIRSGLTAREGA